jgi:hypothetical protein
MQVAGTKLIPPTLKAHILLVVEDPVALVPTHQLSQILLQHQHQRNQLILRPLDLRRVLQTQSVSNLD